MSIRIPKRSARPGSADDGLIPMINIVFLLLIFFMVAGQIASRDASLQLPVSTSQDELLAGEIEITIGIDGVARINGEPVAGDLLDRLQQLSVGESTMVVCRAHQELPARALDPVLAAARALGVRHLQIATEAVH